jgi:hypothetical protein
MGLEGRGFTGCEKLVGADILRSLALRDDEGSRMFINMCRARFFAALKIAPLLG